MVSCQAARTSATGSPAADKAAVDFQPQTAEGSVLTDRVPVGVCVARAGESPCR